MQIPNYLAGALDELPDDPRFARTGGWTQGSEQQWFFRFRARLSAPPTPYVPEWTAWCLVFSGDDSDFDIRIYPDVVDGITATFPHQDFNDPPPAGGLWRTGKPCLERPAAVFRRHQWSGEPEKLVERLIWRIGRLLVWIDSAATDSLLCHGEPLELPVYPLSDVTSPLGFRETTEDLDWLDTINETWGFASISPISESRRAGVITSFMDTGMRRLRQVDWSPAINKDLDRADAIWIALPKLAVFEPWKSATTWSELSQLCQSVSIDLPAILSDAGARLRSIQRPKHATPVHLILGFPLSELFGTQPTRRHWIAVQNLQLCRRDDVRRGFSNKAEARRGWDRELATSDRRLEWRATANWASDQLRKRGEAESIIRSKSVLLLGVGTLGAAVAENLLRMGVTRMALLDNDRMAVGNLSRHLLTMADIGHFKAERMAQRLNLAAPDADVRALTFSFPPTKPAEVEQMAGWDVVIDCTASDPVLKAMGSFPWVSERIFVSLSMTWGAKGMFAYAASETGFPAIDAMERFIAVSPSPVAEVLGTMEAIGCWHPIFPATADDVNLWAALGTKFIRNAISTRARVAAFFVQKDDGSVDRKDA